MKYGKSSKKLDYDAWRKARNKRKAARKKLKDAS